MGSMLSFISNRAKRLELQQEEERKRREAELRFKEKLAEKERKRQEEIEHQQALQQKLEEFNREKVFVHLSSRYYITLMVNFEFFRKRSSLQKKGLTGREKNRLKS
jgi:hypothetical protein